jgi:hypothetical protein
MKASTAVYTEILHLYYAAFDEEIIQSAYSAGSREECPCGILNELSKHR